MSYRILNVPKDGVLLAFQAALDERGMVADSAQQRAVARLQKFYDQLLDFKTARRTRLRKMFVHPPLPRGVWFWGGVGRGKSFLMDCFYATVPYQRKRRVHFHEFMREVHERLQQHKSEADPLAIVAAEVARETRLMCFDEFHVSDIADAMILGRLMAALFAHGVLFCITSNYPPDGLYPNGLHRDRILPTIALLQAKLDVVEVDSGIDYRLRTLEQAEVYHVPADAESDRQLETTFRQLAGGKTPSSAALEIMGRDIPVVKRVPGVAWLSFADLCGGPRSQNDYLELANNFHTILLSHVPQMSQQQSSEARRFTWLVDVFYDHRVKLIITAECAIEALYTSGTQVGEFARTESRLIEMGSHDYLASPHRRFETPEESP